jgi:hypothetical protein
MRKLLKKLGFAPKALVTDKLGSYGSAFRELGLTCRHERGLRKNNRAENSHVTRLDPRSSDARLNQGVLLNIAFSTSSGDQWVEAT